LKVQALEVFGKLLGRGVFEVVKNTLGGTL